MKKKPKTLESRLRAAIRLIWSRSAERRDVLKKASYDASIHEPYAKAFRCPVCAKEWPLQMAEVDHIEPVGTLELNKLTEWVDKMFHSPQQVICKLCHRRKTTQQRQKSKKAK